MEIKEEIQPYLARQYDPGHYSPPVKKLRMPKSKDGLRVSEDNYWKYYYDHPDFNYEWNNGVLEEKAVSNLRGYNLFEWFLILINLYLKTKMEGILVGLEIGFKLKLTNKKSIRKPDLALIHKNNPVQMPPNDKTYKGCFDMCFEILSDSTTKTKENDTVVKKAEYCNFGVKEYYIFDEKKKETAFYKLNKNGIYTQIRPSKGGIIKSSVLTDFQFRKKDLYTQPYFGHLVDDPVYKHFVLKDFQEKIDAERQRADRAETLVKTERQRADKAETLVKTERQRADKAETLVKAEKLKTEKAEMLVQALLREIQNLKKQ